jgi:hypothetical protein
MKVDISAVLEGGYEKTVARTGLQFAAVFFVLSVLNALFVPQPETLPVEESPVGDVAPAAGGGPAGPSLGLSPTVAGLLSLLVTVLTALVTIAAIRTFVAGEAESIPEEYFTRNIAWVAVNFVIGGIAFAIVVGIGLFLLVIPGLFLLVSLFFWQVFIAVKDENFIEGFRHSWQLTKGRRLRLFGLGVVVILVALVISIAFGIPGVFLPGALALLVEQVGSALVFVFVLAATAEAYNRLTAADDEGDAVDTSL